MPHAWRRAVAIFFFVLLPCGARAQDEAVNPLVSASGLRCRFFLTTSAAWKDGQPTAQSTPQETELVISEIDLQSGTADVRGPQGRGFATATISAGSLYIFQIARGELNITSVFATEAAPKRLKAAHTRQDFVYLTVPPLNDTPVLTQSYGDCEVLGSTAQQR